MGLVLLTIGEKFELKLTPKGQEFYNIIRPAAEKLDLSFKDKEQDIPSWDMKSPVADFNYAIRDFINKNENRKEQTRNIFLEMHAVRLMLNYLYRVERKKVISKANIYSGFFNSPEVSMYCDQNGIETATEEGAKHRCPFLLNILEAIGVLDIGRNSVDLKLLLVSPELLKAKDKEPDELLKNRFEGVKKYYTENKIVLYDEEMSILKEMFGKEFLTPKYFLEKVEFTNGE